MIFWHALLERPAENGASFNIKDMIILTLTTIWQNLGAD